MKVTLSKSSGYELIKQKRASIDEIKWKLFKYYHKVKTQKPFRHKIVQLLLPTVCSPTT